jgi:hypothetical protein
MTSEVLHTPCPPEINSSIHRFGFEFNWHLSSPRRKPITSKPQRTQEVNEKISDLLIDTTLCWYEKSYLAPWIYSAAAWRAVIVRWWTVAFISGR